MGKKYNSQRDDFTKLSQKLDSKTRLVKDWLTNFCWMVQVFHQSGFEVEVFCDLVAMRSRHRKTRADAVHHMAASIVGNIPKTLKGSSTTLHIVHFVNKSVECR